MAGGSDPLDRKIHPPPPLSRSELAIRANAFLDRYCPSRTVPVPIEGIVEFDMGLNIIPVPGLHRDTGIDGFISSDLSEITIDEERLEYVGRFHFTLAHEIGHRELHSGLYKQFDVDSIERWKEFVQEIGPSLYERLETEANDFAGFVLVPSQQLGEKFQENLQKAEKLGITTAVLSDQVLEYVGDFLAKEFEVSSHVVRIRLERERWFGRRRQ